MQELHESEGVNVRLNAAIESILGDSRVTGLQLTDGTRIEADAIVVGIGIIPATELAMASGLGCDSGILAGSDCITACHHVGVVGDVAQAFHARSGCQLRLESWQNAEQQAEIVARAFFGENPRWFSVPWVWSDQYDWNIQSAGMPQLADNFVKRGNPADDKVLYFGIRDSELVGALAFGRGKVAAKDLRVAMMMMEQGVSPPADQLSDPDMNLKQLLRSG